MEARKREQILKLLEADSRTTVREIAVMLGLGEDEVQDEIAQLEKERIICGYHAFVNWDKTEDDNISALIELKVTLSNRYMSNPQPGVKKSDTHSQRLSRQGPKTFSGYPAS